MSSAGEESTMSSFPELVFRMLENETKKKNSPVDWVNNGEAFVVQNNDPELAKILSKYFSHSQYTSFQRQLNMYGWRKHVSGKYRGSFHHPMFRRGDASQLALIKRRPPPRRSRSSNSSKNSKTSSKKPAKRNTKRNTKAKKRKPAVAAKDTSLKEDTVVEDVASLTDASSLKSGEGWSYYDDEEESEEEEEYSKTTRDDDDDTSTSSSLSLPQRPIAKFEIRQKVFAKDHDGVMYEAAIRRRQWGPHHHMQLPVGIMSQAEIDAKLEQAQEPTWYYFVHYNKWNVNWDRWVAEEDIFEINQDTIAYSNLLLKEHRALQKQLKSNRKQLDGGAFVKEWRHRLAQLERQREMEQRRQQLALQGMQQDDEEEKDEEPESLRKNDATSRQWSKAFVTAERKRRDKELETDKLALVTNRIVLPFALKRMLVEEWEIISQCHMLPKLPAAVTVRQALDKYLEHKIAMIETQQQAQDPTAEDGERANNDNGEALETHSTQETSTKEKKTSAEEDEREEDTKDESGDNDKVNDKKQEWVEMVDGIALFFDQALPFRLLYRQETEQHARIEEDPDLSQKRMSDVYGCEHLLRLFLRLPSILKEELSDAEMRPILAKVNDFVRFLHNHQAAVFTQSYRKRSEADVSKPGKKKRKRETKGAASKKAKLKDSSTTDDPQAQSVGVDQMDS